MVFERIQQALFFWWKNLLPLFLVTVPFALLSSTAELLNGPIFVVEGETFKAINSGTAVMVLLLQIAAEAALICQLASLANGRQRNLFDCFLFALYVFFPLALTMMLMSLPMAASLLFAAAAEPALMLFFVAPVVWIYLRLALAPFYVALERLSPVAALQKSFHLTGPNQWPLLLSWLIAMIMMLIMAATLQGAVNQLAGDHGGGLIVISVAQKLLGALVTIVLFQAYRGVAPPTSPRPDTRE
jgi:hypothetical protein